MSNPQERYQKLEIAESLSIPYRYPLACMEMGFILRGAYSQLPKDLQSSILQDMLAAFRLLPQIQTKDAVSATNFLIQAAEAALPKQKKNIAVKEFKQAKIAYKRLSKMQKQEKECAQLPHDILVHIFSFLDFYSLPSSGLVSSSWRLAANDNTLWQSQYARIFGNSDSSFKLIADNSPCLDWRGQFIRKYRENPFKVKRLVCSRGYCTQCETFFCLSSGQPTCTHNSMKQIGPHQVVDYLIDELSSSDSDNDSDPETGTANRLWSHRYNLID